MLVKLSYIPFDILLRRRRVTKGDFVVLRGLFGGLTTIDIQYLVNTFPRSNSKTVASQFAMSVGGPATNAAITFAYLVQSHPR